MQVILNNKMGSAVNTIKDLKAFQLLGKQTPPPPPPLLKNLKKTNKKKKKNQKKNHKKKKQPQKKKKNKQTNKGPGSARKLPGQTDKQTCNFNI